MKGYVLGISLLLLVRIGLARQGVVYDTSRVFLEKKSVVSIEAENFFSQQHTEQRKWAVVRKGEQQKLSDDPDPNHAISASGGYYLECLPDTRITHDEKLIHGVNFSNTPGVMAVLNYRIKFENVGRYYVWVRAYSTGGEDNGIHVGIDGSWPETGQRMQWCDGKNQWTWASKQRTEAVHCGEPKLIYLDVETSGIHTISFSMREDGFEFDKWVMSMEYNQPDGLGPKQSNSKK